MADKHTATPRPGPYAAPAGSTPKNYLVKITAVVAWSNTDPTDWDFEALLEHIQITDPCAIVEAVELVPAVKADK